MPKRPRLKVRTTREPTLDMVLMVEKTIREAGKYPSKTELWKALPKKIQYQTFRQILEHLERSNKIVFDGRKIVWVSPDNPKLKRLLKTSMRL